MGDDSRRQTHAKRFVHLILYCDLHPLPERPREKKKSMSAELDLNAYVLLGNALNYLVSGAGVDSEAQLGVPAAAIASLYRRIEPLTPRDILPAIAAFPPVERSLLDRCCRYCLRTIAEYRIPTLLGLPRAVAEDVLTQLALEPARHA
jgi:hypothetical protein